ncbi:TPA: GNAT family protein [Vibrio cholerae]|uniref:GNAT family N-acetyltransferase n=1 Tax=Vibrio cholerae TaxID=666 RepID=UPI00226DA1F0|nr:GNAT family protein [Vibrio cholerae]MCX9439913.1 GNAT family N-acetyltransferase [Vibrio cholerae]HDI3164206.1 GNAT family N-acetyltransferase [Vibrio cholerae]
METAAENCIDAKLIEFRPKDYQLLINWIDSDELNYLWGGPQFEYPLTIKQLQQHYAQDKALPFLFIVDNEAVGFIELYKVSDIEHRVCRVFIHPVHRGKSYGIIMLGLAITRAKIKYQSKVLTLGVFAHNQSAIACYEQLGFKTYEIVSGLRFFNGKNWDLVRMSQSL